MFRTNNLIIPSDFSLLRIYSSKKSKSPITVSFFVGMKTSNLLILVYAYTSKFYNLEHLH